MAEGWVRKRPRRILHNEVLIVSLFCVARLSPFPIAVLVLWLLSVPWLPLIGLVIWLCGSVAYIALTMHYRRSKDTKSTQKDLPEGWFRYT